MRAAAMLQSDPAGLARRAGYAGLAARRRPGARLSQAPSCCLRFTPAPSPLTLRWVVPGSEAPFPRAPSGTDRPVAVATLFAAQVAEQCFVGAADASTLLEAPWSLQPPTIDLPNLADQ